MRATTPTAAQLATQTVSQRLRNRPKHFPPVRRYFWYSAVCKAAARLANTPHHAAALALVEKARGQLLAGCTASMLPTARKAAALCAMHRLPLNLSEALNRLATAAREAAATVGTPAEKPALDALQRARIAAMRAENDLCAARLAAGQPMYPQA